MQADDGALGPASASSRRGTVCGAGQRGCRATGRLPRDRTRPRTDALACLLFALLAWLPPSAMAEPPSPPSGKVWVEVWGDEFDGDALEGLRALDLRAGLDGAVSPQ